MTNKRPYKRRKYTPQHLEFQHATGMTYDEYAKLLGSVPQAVRAHWLEHREIKQYKHQRDHGFHQRYNCSMSECAKIVGTNRETIRKRWRAGTDPFRPVT